MSVIGATSQWGVLPGGWATEGNPNQAVRPDRASISESLDHHDKALVVLHDVISNLEARLVPVLRSPGPTQGPHGEQPKAVEILIANRIQSLTSLINQATNRLSIILERVEI